MSREWSTNRAGKTSHAVYWVLRIHGYLKLDKETGTVLIRAKSLLKERSYQEVEGWFMKAYSGAYPVLMAELENILKLNCGRGLERQTESAAQESRQKYSDRFCREKQKP